MTRFAAVAALHLCAWALALACFVASASVAAQSTGNAMNETARVVSLRGAVEVLAPEPRTAREGETLTRGTRVRTGAHAAVVLALANGSLIELDENGLIALFDSPTPAENGAVAPAVTTLSRGVARVRMSPSGLRAEPLAIATQAVTVWAGRSDAMIAADLGGHITRMAVWRGRMRVRMGTREYLLTQGYGVVEEQGHPPGTLRLLPRPPVWRAAPPTRVLSFGEPMDVSGVWAANPRGAQTFPASEWKVQVARDDGFRDLVETQRVPVGTTRWTGRSYAPGTYHVRVVAIDVQRFESTASPIAHVEIAAPMVIPASEGPDAQRAMVRVPRGFYCGLDDAALTSWEQRLLLTPGRPHRLRCALTPAGANAREHVITAGMSGPLRREVRVAPAAAAAINGSATGALSLRLRDAENQPVSLARIEATASDGVSVDAVRETGERGVYTATLRWPEGVRSCRLQFTINEALRFEHEARVEEVRVVPAATAQARVERPTPRVEVIHYTPPADPDDEAPINPEE